MKKRKSLLRSDSFQTLLTSLLCIILGVAIGYVVLLIINPAGAWKSMSALLKNFFHIQRLVYVHLRRNQLGC